MLRSAALAGASNLAGQTAGLRMDDNQCNNTDYNYGSLFGSMIGGSWASAITRGAGPVSSAIIGWSPATASGALGSELGRW